jgi:hypothetical protein
MKLIDRRICKPIALKNFNGLLAPGDVGVHRDKQGRFIEFVVFEDDTSAVALIDENDALHYAEVMRGNYG